MPQFKDIMTREVVFLDTEYQEECKTFCRTRDISFLPSIHHPKVCYNYLTNTHTFERHTLLNAQIVHPEENIFTIDVINKFKHFEIMFVLEHDELKGLVHFSDYNTPLVYEEVYKKLYKLERGIVYLITQYGGKSVGELETFLQMNKKKRAENVNDLLNRQEFSKRRIRLSSLLDFVIKIDLLRIQDAEKITLLRNKIAHSHDLVSRYNYQEDELKYDFETFEEMVEGRVALDIAIKQIANRAYFMQAISQNDFNLSAENVYERVFA